MREELGEGDGDEGADEGEDGGEELSVRRRSSMEMDILGIDSRVSGRISSVSFRVGSLSPFELEGEELSRLFSSPEKVTVLVLVLALPLGSNFVFTRVSVLDNDSLRKLNVDGFSHEEEVNVAVLGLLGERPDWLCQEFSLGVMVYWKMLSSSSSSSSQICVISSRSDISGLEFQGDETSLGQKSLAPLISKFRSVRTFFSFSSISLKKSSALSSSSE